MLGAVGELVSIPLESGERVIIEVDDHLAGVRRATRPGEVVEKAGQTLEGALDETLVPVARAVIERLKLMKPQQAEVTLGLKLTGEVGFVISKAAGEASLMVKLTWKEQGT
jgi:Trypsin-co-occurring domain 1